MTRSLIPLLIAGAAFGSVSDDLQRFEGFSDTSYVCTAGHLSVGYGHRTTKSVTMSRETALDVLADDIAKAEQGARRAFPSYGDLPTHIQEVLVEAVFQLGQSGISKFTKFIKAINGRNYADAAAEMLNSKWAKQCPTRVNELAQRIKETK